MPRTTERTVGRFWFFIGLLVGLVAGRVSFVMQQRARRNRQHLAGYR